jgi:putative ABC transport system permease protein
MSRKAAMVLAASFGLLSLFLSAVGIYGVLAYLATKRSREIGICIALGSTNRGIFIVCKRPALFETKLRVQIMGGREGIH